MQGSHVNLFLQRGLWVLDGVAAAGSKQGHIPAVPRDLQDYARILQLDLVQARA